MDKIIGVKRFKVNPKENTVKRITIVRNEKGLSQSALARKAGVNQTSLCRIEKGKEPPYPLRAQRIADALGWSGDPSELFEDVSEDEQPRSA